MIKFSKQSADKARVTRKETLLYLLVTYLISSIPLALSIEHSWQVDINTKFDDQNINGAGFLVKIDDSYFISTAAHVTLGSELGSFTTGSGEKLEIVPGDNITHNGMDTQLIRVKKPKRSTPVAIYNNDHQYFYVTDQHHSAIQDDGSSKKHLNSSSSRSSYYLVPKASTGSASQFEEKTKSYPEPYIDMAEQFSEMFINKTADGFSMRSFAQSSPGDSGSPVFRIYRDSDTTAADPKYISVITGHVSSTQLYSDRSNFIWHGTYANLINQYQVGRRGNLDSTQWGELDGVFYRYKQTENGIIKEINDLQTQTGNGTGVGTGNGTGVGTGNGTGVGTGNGTGVGTGNGTGVGTGNGTGVGTGQESTSSATRKYESINYGMIYHDVPIVGFRVKEIDADGNFLEYTVEADWNNYQALENKKSGILSYEPIPLNDGSIESLIIKKSLAEGKATQVPSSPTFNQNCKVLLRGDKKIAIKINGFEESIIDIDREFFPIHYLEESQATNTATTQDEQTTIDLRGLFTVDLSEFASLDSEINTNTIIPPAIPEITFYRDKPFITVRKEGFKHTKLTCEVTLVKDNTTAVVDPNINNQDRRAPEPEANNLPQSSNKQTSTVTVE